MRFRRIEKDGGGVANVGLSNQHIQGKEDDVTTSESKTYIGSNAKKKVAMNKIKNTKVGDDIHYYINGQEGRGIVVKMANEYLEVFKENGQLGTIHINDTFFVKDILVNKQWDDMDSIERYEALTKIHAPSPRYITKQWHDIPEQIKVLLQKDMPGGTGSTYEQGESKDSETQDHSRTGFAQNAQYAEKVNYKPRWKDPETGAQDFTEHGYRYEREEATEKNKKHMKPEEHIGHPDYFNKEKNPFWNKRVETDPNKLDSKGVPYGKGHHKTYHPDDPVSDHTKSRKNKKGEAYTDNYVHAGNEAKLRARRQNQQNIHTKEAEEADDEAKYQKYKKRRSGYDKAKKIVSDAEDKQQKNLTDQWAKDHPEPKNSTPSDSCPTCGTSHPGLVHEKKPEEKKPSGDKPSGGFVIDEDDYKGKALYKQWLEKKVKRPSPRTAHGSFGTTQSEAGQEAQQSFSDATTSAASALGVDFGTATKTYLEIMKPAALPKGTKPNPNLHEAFSVDDEDYKHLTPNQQKQYDQEEREREEDEPNAEEWLDIVDRRVDGKPGKKGDKERLAAIERDEQKRLKDRKETGSQPANPKKKAETYEERSTQKAYEVWLERQELNKVQLRYEEDERDSGKIEVEDDPDNPGKTRRKRKKKPAKKSDRGGEKRRKRKNPKRENDPPSDVNPEGSKPSWESKPHRKPEGHESGNEEGPGEDSDKGDKYKSDVEHGRYGNAAGTPEVGVSTDTKVDVTTGTGYEERPHISVEEAGKLPRATFNESGSELTVSGSQNNKDEPKFSQPHSQEHPVRKAGLPQQHPNTYGVRYGMKGGVKKVWCPEHQVWEETRKDWHE